VNRKYPKILRNRKLRIERRLHGWLMKGELSAKGFLSPNPLLHKPVEEREKKREFYLHEPAVRLPWLNPPNSQSKELEVLG
jgi:hypothetical protein